MLATVLLAQVLFLTEPAAGQMLHEVRGQAPGDGFGLAVARVPDLDGDGVDELAVGAPARGQVRILSGASGEARGTLRGSAGFGGSLAVEDVDADGRLDLLVGPVAGDPSLRRVIDGCDGGDLAPVRRDTLGGPMASRGSASGGRRVMPLGDLNGDGLDDWAAAGPLGDAARRIELRSGSDGSLLHVLEGEGAPDAYGWSVADAGDVDGDGSDDVIVGAPGDDVGGLDAGAAWVHSGRTGEALATLHGGAGGERLGSLVGSLGDADGDGLAEVWVTAFEGTRDGPGLGVIRVYRVSTRPQP